MTSLATGPTARFDAKPGTVDWYVWQLIRAADSMRHDWAECAPDSPRRNELWRDLHTAADVAAAAPEEGPEGAARMAQAEREMRERERRLALGRI